MLESEFQARLIKKLEELLPGCIILKNDTSYRQGIPDLVILYKNRWALLEVKSAYDARHQPNQEYYIALAHDMSYAAFIYPENEEEVLDALQQSLEPSRASRVSQR